MVKVTKLDQIEPAPDGTLMVRFALTRPAGTANKWHRTSFPPDCDIDVQCEAVNAHLTALGEMPLLATDIETIHKIAAQVWTPEVLAAYSQLAN